MKEDNHLTSGDQSRAKHDNWWWLYFIGFYDTITVVYHHPLLPIHAQKGVDK